MMLPVSGRRNQQWHAKCVANAKFFPRSSQRYWFSPGEMYIQRFFTSYVQFLCQILVPMCRQHSSQEKRSPTTGNQPHPANQDKVSDLRNWLNLPKMREFIDRLHMGWRMSFNGYRRRVACRITRIMSVLIVHPWRGGKIRRRMRLLGSWGSSVALNLIYQCLISRKLRLILSGVNEAPETVRHCLSMFFTHINFQQYWLSTPYSNGRCEFINGPAFLEDLKTGTVQPCLINAICAVSAR